MLWVHGYTIDSSLWGPLWDALPGWRHIGVDLPGHGASPPLAAQETLPSLARRLADWAIQNDVQHVVGLSLGSTIALQTVLEGDGAFATLTLGAPAIGGGPVEAQVGVRYTELLRLIEQLDEGPWLAHRWMSSPPHLFTYARETPFWSDIEAVVGRHRWSELRGFAIGRLAAHAQPLEQISRLRARLLLLVGEHELPAFVETADLLKRTVDEARIERLAGVGHLCMLEAPELCAHFIARHWAAGVSLGSQPGFEHVQQGA